MFFINAAPDLATVDFGTGTGAGATPTFSVLVTGVAFGAAAMTVANDTGAVDANDYLSLPPTTGLEFTCHVSVQTGSDTATASSLSVSVGDIMALVLINGKNGVSLQRPQFLVCTADGKASAMGLTSPCTVVTQ